MGYALPMQIDSLPPLREVIAAHGLQAKKQLGQNFLLDLNLTARIARASGPLEGMTVIEVGPGPGGLTRALLAEGARRVIAIERDERALPALAEIQAAYPGRLDVIAGDAMKTDYRALADGPTRIVANLPYNIGTELLTGWLTLEMDTPGTIPAGIGAFLGGLMLFGFAAGAIAKFVALVGQR